MQKTELLVVRHGETNWNAAGRIQGFLDVPLNERGRKQARRLATKLQSQPLDAIYSSDLSRAVQTARPLARRQGKVVQTRADLREWNLGCFENLTIGEARARAEHAYEGYRNMDPDLAIPDGETFRAFYTRCIDGVEDLLRQHAGQRLALFTHGGVVINFLRRAQRMAVEDALRYYIPNAARFSFQCNVGDEVEWLDYSTETPLVPWFGTAAKA